MTSRQVCEDNEQPGSNNEQNLSIPSAPLTAPLWTVDDVAEFLQLQPETIRSMARRGELPAIKLGKVWRFEKTAVRELLHSLVSDY